MFAALDDDDASTLYYSLAFIYALPYFASGFELDGFALFSVLLCILHVQASSSAGARRYACARAFSLLPGSS